MVIPQLLDGRSRAKLFPEDLRIFLAARSRNSSRICCCMGA